ncbi:hypothetical protein QOT17_000380 [Balamuthia mandrillaris]
MQRLFNKSTPVPPTEDLSASLWGDVLRQCEGDKERALELASGMSQAAADEEKQRTQERMVAELQQTFPLLGKEVIVRSLVENDWDSERAILPLFAAVEEHREKERKLAREEALKKREAERLQLKEEASKKAKTFLRQLFSNIPEEEVQAYLDQNEGDVDATVDQLLALMNEREQRENEAKQKHEEKELIKRQMALERQLKIDTLKERFEEYVEEEEVVATLEAADMDVPSASNELLRLTEKRKKERLLRLYPAVTGEQVLTVLNDTNWDIRSAMAELAKIQQETKANSPIHHIKEDKGKEKEDEEKFLLRSAILGKELTELIQVQTAEVALEINPHSIFRQELENKLRFGPEDLPGLPGMIPLTRKMIDKMQAAPFVDEEEEPAGASPQQQQGASPVEDSLQSSIVAPAGKQDEDLADGFVLTATPERLDKGGKIRVSWDASCEVTTSDWVGMYSWPEGAASPSVKGYYTYNWIGKVQKQGSIVFPAPKLGRYVFRYFSNKSYKLVATSNPVSVGPVYTLTAAQHPALEAEQAQLSVDVRVEHLSGNMYPNAWVALYDDSNAPHSAYKTYQWVSSAVDHVLSFSVPKTGCWEFRLFPERRYYPVARCTALVRGEDSVDFEADGSCMKVRCKVATVDPTTDYVWIGIYRVEEQDNKMYRKYKYLASGLEELTFKSCTTPGLYEVRLFANKYYDGFLCKSNTIRI